jgi:phosphatidylinositol-3-phosphatase
VIRRVLAAVYLTVCTVAAVARSSGPPTPAPGTTSPMTTPPSASASSAASVSRPDHVVIVVLENKNEADVLPEGHYLAALAASGATDMHAETHPSQPNYLALFSGDTQGVTDDRCPPTTDTPNLATELIEAGYSFADYAEDLPEAGYGGCQAGAYARKHSPWTDFSTVPAAANLPLSSMPTDYASLPTLSFEIPNLCHDMHD